jgi:hypothetical protein
MSLRRRVERLEQAQGVGAPEVRRRLFVEQHADGRRRILWSTGGRNLAPGDKLPDGFDWVVVMRP